MATEFKSNSYSGRQLILSLVQDGQYIDWTLTSSGGSSSYYAVADLCIKINGTLVYGEDKQYWIADSAGWPFPARTGSTSGTIYIGTSAKTIKVVFKGSVYERTGVDYGGNFDFSEVWTDAGGATVNSIVDNGDNTLTIVTTMGTNGTNNAVSNVHIYGFVNKTTGNPSTHDSDFFASGDGAYGTISGRTVTFIIPISAMKNPPTVSPYTVRVRAYSISARGDNPGGECLNSGELLIRKAIKVYGNNGDFQVGELYASPNKDGVFKEVTALYRRDANNNWKKLE